MNRLFCLLLLVCHALWASGADFDLDMEIAQMRSAGKQQKLGESADTGFYIICIEEVPVEDGINDHMARELALAQAKRTIAGFFKTEVDSSLTQTKEVTVLAEDGHENALIREMTMESTRIDIGQLLKGVIVYQAEHRENGLEVICFLSRKIADAATEMKEAMDELPPDTVRAVGLAMLGNSSLDTARDNALQMAKRQAVEQILGSTVASTTQVQDADQIRAKIFASSGGFIETYRIVEESSMSDAYRVTIVATVARKKLLSDYSAHLKALGNPGFYIRTDHRELYGIFVKFFAELGLRLVTEREAADYVIDAIGEYRHLKHPASGRDGVQLGLWIRVFDAVNDRELLMQRNDSTRSAVFHASGERQKEIAAQKAFEQIKEPLHQALNRLIGKMSASGREVEIVLDRYSDIFSDELAVITAGVGMIPGCSPASVKIDGIGMRAVLTVEYVGAMDALEHFLRTVMQKEIQKQTRIPKTVSISTNRLELSF